MWIYSSIIRGVISPEKKLEHLRWDQGGRVRSPCGSMAKSWWVSEIKAFKMT